MNRDPHAWERLSRALRQAREHAGLTQAELAQRAKTATASVQSAEAGTVPKRRMPPTLAPIAKALGWPIGAVDAILDGGDPPQPADPEGGGMPEELRALGIRDERGILDHPDVRKIMALRMPLSKRIRLVRIFVQGELDRLEEEEREREERDAS